MEETYTLFADELLIANGSLMEITQEAKNHMEKNKKSSLLAFEDETGRVVDLDFRDTTAGRPKLGVVAREVTLLPRHWDWLATQPGGASITLRKLVEEAKKKSSVKDKIRQAQDTTYKFMMAMAGDREGYEEALRALYAKNASAFKKLIASWPKDVKNHVKKLSENVWLES